MIKSKQIVPNPAFNPELPVNHSGYGPNGFDTKVINRPLIWKFADVTRPLQPGDVVEFLCSGRGRGNHLCVHARVTKVNKKTFKAIELPRSYSPGTNWTVNIEHAMVPGNGGITINLSWDETK
jgi:hypothetical protein